MALRPTTRRLVVAYLILLVTSHLWRLRAPEMVTTRPKVEVKGGGAALEVAYQDFRPTGTAKATLLALHGSPGSSDDFARLGPMLAARGLRVIAPDLPGFGESSREVTDYSIVAHAEAARQLLDQLSVSAVDVLGFSMGGGVALHLAEEEPKVRSLILLAAIGVQEHELLGRYDVNHALHGAQLAGLFVVHELLPHFGFFDGAMLDLPYARNFFDSDQRPLRPILEKLAPPVLIIHGEEDMLVPFAAAQEHQRLVPQSRLLSFADQNHFTIFLAPELLAEPIADFVATVDAGTALTRATADPERIAAAALPESKVTTSARGPAILVWVLLLAFSTLLSEDLTCIAGGLLAARGTISFGVAVFGCAAGIFFGDLLLYLVGRFGRPFFARGRFLWIKSQDLEVGRQWLEKRGPLVIFLSRFIPGTRLPVYVSAGLLGFGFWRFAFYLLLPVLLWTPLLVGLAFWLGDRFVDDFALFERGLWPFVVLLLSFWALLTLGRGLLTYRGRRLMVGRWRRLTQWEFWPLWAFYPPIVVYLIYLACRFRSATLFTAVNPGMPGASGFVGESKVAILEKLDPRFVATFESLPPADVAHRISQVEAFMARLGLGFPIVLKPDVGQRGSGVTIAHDRAAVEKFFEAQPDLAIVQRFIAGPELGVFYVRLPDEPRGRIFSITDKRLPEIIGDGQASIENLILADRRAVAMAPTYLERFHDRLDHIPEPGERIRLVELGTHCRGAVFLEGGQYHSAELEAEIERIAASFDGFYFGRFDLRAPSYEHFRRGEGVRVLELNGVTSESTNIYDPKNSLFQGYRVLFAQWRLAFEIGRRNRASGFKPIGLRGLWRLWRATQAK